MVVAGQTIRRGVLAQIAKGKHFTKKESPIRLLQPNDSGISYSLDPV
jgi:hypothetical protein